MNVRSVKTAAARGRGRPRVDDKRRIILDAALTVFAERGFHGTAVPEVAAAAGVGTGTLYRYFANKEALVNEVYRDAKTRLAAALFGPDAGARELTDREVDRPGAAKAWFVTLWRRLAGFARAEPAAFRFLEMQDHQPYLDADSRRVELAILAPLWLTGKKLRDRASGPPVDVTIALLWGAFVGLVKASRLGYVALDDAKLDEAGATCWRMVAPEPAPRPRRRRPGPRARARPRARA